MLYAALWLVFSQEQKILQGSCWFGVLWSLFISPWSFARNLSDNILGWVAIQNPEASPKILGRYQQAKKVVRQYWQKVGSTTGLNYWLRNNFHCILCFKRCLIGTEYLIRKWLNWEVGGFLSSTLLCAIPWRRCIQNTRGNRTSLLQRERYQGDTGGIPIIFSSPLKVQRRSWGSKRLARLCCLFFFGYMIYSDLFLLAGGLVLYIYVGARWGWLPYEDKQAETSRAVGPTISRSQLG